MEGEQNVGGFGETAAKEYSQFNWFTKKIFQNEIPSRLMMDYPS